MSSHTIQSCIQWSKQKNTLGLSYSSPQKFEAGASGAANGTSIVATTLASTFATDDAAAGLMVEVIRCANGPTGERGAPIRRRVVAYDYTTATMTIEALPWQTADGDSFALLNPPNAWWAEDTGGNATYVADATRGEADNYWTGAAEKGGPYMTVVNAANVASTLNAIVGVFSTTDGNAFATLGANTAIGDLYEAWEYPEVFSGFPLTFSQPRLPHASIVGSMGTPRGTAALIEGSGSLELAFRGPGRSRIGEAAEIDTPLGSITSASSVADCTADTGGTVSSVDYSAGSPSVNEIFCAENGDAFVATAVAGSAITPSPSLRSALVSGNSIYGLRRYTQADAINYAMTLKQWHGKESFDVLYGCVPQFQVSGARGEYLKFTLPFQVADGYRVYLDETDTAYSRPYNPKLPTIVPRVLGDCRVVCDAVEFEARSFTLDLGLDIQPKQNLAAPNCHDAFEIRNDKPEGQIDLFLGTDGRQITQKWLYGKPMTLMIQAGKHPGEPGVFVFWAYEVEVDDVTYTDDAGAMVAQVKFHATWDSTQTDLSRWMIGIG